VKLKGVTPSFLFGRKVILLEADQVLSHTNALLSFPSMNVTASLSTCNHFIIIIRHLYMSECVVSNIIMAASSPSCSFFLYFFFALIALLFWAKSFLYRLNSLVTLTLTLTLNDCPGESHHHCNTVISIPTLHSGLDIIKTR